MAHTTPCLIKRNTPELRRKLEELGYSYYYEKYDCTYDDTDTLFLTNGYPTTTQRAGYYVDTYNDSPLVREAIDDPLIHTKKKISA